MRFTNLKAVMFYEWLNIGSNRWTNVSSIGSFQPVANRKLSDKESNTKLFLVIPGNPGVCHFYEQFAEHLQRKLPNSSVWVISHLNHVQRPIELQSTSEVTLLHDQIKHKLDFILKFIPKNVDLYLIGHSIGSYMILHLLNSLTETNGYNVKMCFLLFPTVERMAESPNGQKFVSSTKYGFHYLILLFASCAYYLPDFVKEWLIRRRFNNQNVHRCIFDGVMQILNGSAVLSNVIFMAINEMKIVTKLDVDIIKRFHHKLTILYGSSDDWCPLSYCTDMERIAENTAMKIVRCDSSIEHAFVISNGSTVADILVDLM